jgi:PIN domain nuclease of toxin-antitoxin system
VTGSFLADACAVIAFYTGAGRKLSAAARAAMQGRACVSPITVWELTQKIASGKLPPLILGGGSLSQALAHEGFTYLPLTWVDAERANGLPPIHKDPMDRILIAQALSADLTIITIDRLFEGYGVRTVW